MEGGIINALRGKGFDVEAALARFLNNEALYEKFLRKFPYDENFSELLDNLKKGEFEAAFQNAHTLKGVASNLGLDSLTDIFTKISDVLRSGETGSLAEISATAEKEYAEVVEIIKERM